jgi:hypothetical protein
MMSNHPYATRLLELSEHLASSFVAFSGKRPASGTPAVRETCFETLIDMLRAGFEPSYGLTTIAGLTMPGEPAVNELRKDELFDPAFRDATAVLCLYIHSLARGAMSPTDADRFDNALQSSIARLCAGQFGFDPQPPKVFGTIQELIHLFLSETWINERSIGRDDCLGTVLNHLVLSPDGHTRYAFVVGSKKHPTGCAALFIRALEDTQTLFST